MIPPREKEKVRELIKETLTLLCKNGLSFCDMCTIEAVIGITMDGKDVLLVSMNEMIRSEMENQTAPNENWSQKPDLAVLSSNDDTMGSEACDVSMVVKVADSSNASEELAAKRVKCDAKIAGKTNEISQCDANSNRVDLLHTKHKRAARQENPVQESDSIVIKEEITDEDGWILPGVQASDSDSPRLFAEEKDVLTSAVSFQPGEQVKNSSKGQENISDCSHSSQYQSSGSPLQKMGFVDTWSHWMPHGWSPPLQQAPFTCQTCGKSYKTKDYLQRHEKSHDASLFMCKKCTQFFPSQELYDMHVEMKHGEMERKHICAICGKGFNRVQYLYRHIGMHEKQIARNALFGMAYSGSDNQTASCDEVQESV